jgi:hypothetical protein
MDGQTAAVGTGAVALTAGAYSFGVHGWLEWLVILVVVLLVLRIFGISFKGIWDFFFDRKPQQ